MHGVAVPFQEILERDHERIPHLAGGRRPVLEQGQATELVAQDGRLARTRRRDGGSQGAQDDGRGKLVRVLDDPFQAPEMLEQDPARLYPRAEPRLVDVGEGDVGCGWRAHASALCQRRPGHTMENVITIPGGFRRGGCAALCATLLSPRAPSSAAALSGRTFAVREPFP